MFNAPDIKGPRFRKRPQSLLTKKLYAQFIKTHPQHNVSYDKFKKVVKSSLTKMWNVAISERDGIELPIGGSLFVGSTKIRKKNNYDIQASIKANKPIKHRNYESDGYVAKIYYSPYLSKIGGRDRSIWSFKGSRDFKRALSAVYPGNWKKYIMVTDLYTVVNNYRRSRVRNFMIDNTNKKVQMYNEFES